MTIIVNMATFPGRVEALCRALDSLSPQVDVINLVMNEYSNAPEFLAKYDKLRVFLPEKDLKDTGKFLNAAAADDDVFLCDDDIVYPADYVTRMMAIRQKFANLDPIIGVHGVIYSDFFGGQPESRVVYVFKHALAAHKLVNQLGSGTVYCKGHQLPPFEFMETAQKFVDLRMAVWAHRQTYPMICVARKAEWLQDIAASDSIFHSYTASWPAHVTREAQEIAGYAKLDFRLLKTVELEGVAA